MNELFDAGRLSFTYRVWLVQVFVVGLANYSNWFSFMSASLTYLHIFWFNQLSCSSWDSTFSCHAFHCHVFVTCTGCKKGFSAHRTRGTLFWHQVAKYQVPPLPRLVKVRLRFGSDGLKQIELRDRGWKEKSYRYCWFKCRNILFFVQFFWWVYSN